MSVSLAHFVRPAARRLTPAASAHWRKGVERLTDWLKRAEQRRAERVIAQYLCDSGIHHISDSIERDIAFRHTGAP